MTSGKSLSQLRDERDRLLKKSDAVKLKVNRNRKDNIERVRIEREIRALKSPTIRRIKSARGSIRRAGISTKKSLEPLRKGTLKFLKKRASIISENINRIDEEEAKKKRRRKTTSRKIKRRKR